MNTVMMAGVRHGARMIIMEIWSTTSAVEIVTQFPVTHVENVRMGIMGTATSRIGTLAQLHLPW